MSRLMLYHEQIVRATGVPLRTVERDIDVMEERLRVSTAGTLIAKAALLGLVPWEWMAGSRQ